MLTHYIKISLRNLRKQKLLAFINIFGLSVGIACFSLFLLYAVNEFSFDKFHQQADNIYRVGRWIQAFGDRPAAGDTYMPMPLGPALKEDFPDVKEYVRFQEVWGESFVRYNNEVSRIEVAYADPAVFSVFTFKSSSGNLSSSLQNLHHVVLTASTAKKIFGNEDAVGKSIGIKVDDQFIPFIVSAIAEDLPVNSTIQFQALCNFEVIATTPWGSKSVNNWRRSAYQTYVLLEPGSQLASNKKGLQDFYNKCYPEEETDLEKTGSSDEDASTTTYIFQPIRDMHTNISMMGGSVPPVDPKNILILLCIAGGVLIIACINFTTLSIGRSAGRAREIGVRRVIGSRKKQLVAQFMTEALLMTFFSAVAGLLLAGLLLPYFNQLSGRTLQFSFAAYPQMSWLLFVLILLVGILAGSYPSLVLSRFKPIEVLKNKIRVGGSNLFTKSLVTFQFVLSIGLLISTMVILQQVKFMQSKNPGFNKENVLVIDASETDSKRIYPLLKQALMSDPQITGVASAELSLGADRGWSRSGFEYNGKHHDVFEYFIDPDYMKVLGMQLIAGRNFDPAITDDTVSSVIVNETMLQEFGWSVDSAIGKQIVGYSESKTPVVIGVVNDFNFMPMSQAVSAQLFHQFGSYQPYKYLVRIKPGNISATIASIGKSWSVVAPEFPFKYSFLEEDLDRFYQSEQRWNSIVGWAGGISIFLACLGLFGLAALTVINRTKEIGIRKVLGASLTAIVQLISKDFLKLVFIALVIAAPLAWYFMSQWLQDYAYRIQIGWWVFVFAGSAALLTALVTVSFHAIRTAVANPVKSLRTE
ncbi:MAG: ABC transporter permease [Chitinophagales bacterium]